MSSDDVQTQSVFVILKYLSIVLSKISLRDNYDTKWLRQIILTNLDKNNWFWPSI